MKEKRSLNSYQKEKIMKSRGFKCQFCGREREKDLLEIHHINGNPQDNKKTNLWVLCGPKTRTKCHTRVQNLSKAMSGGSGRSRERNKTPKRKTKIPLKELVNYQQGSTEMQVNDFAEPDFRKWVCVMILICKKKGSEFLFKDAMNGGAEYFEVSPKTTRPYLEKLISITGPLYDYKNESKKRVLGIREGKLNEVKRIAGNPIITDEIGKL
jgi:hypothetical protein